MEPKGSWLQKIAVLYLIIWTIAPPLGIDMIYRILAICVAGIWTMIAMTRGFIVKGIAKNEFNALLFMVAVMLIAFVQEGDIDGILQQIAIYILVIAYLMNSYYSECRWVGLGGLIPIILILLAVFNYISAQALVENPHVARSIVRADEETYVYMRQGIGGYGLIYPQVCIFPAILAWIISAFQHKKLYFLIGCVWMVTYVMFLLNAGYSIAVFATVVGALMLFLYKKKNVLGVLILTIAIFIVFMAALLYWDAFRESMLQIFDGTKVASKINDLVSTNETGVTEASIQSRLDAYADSFNTIFKYPFIGGLWMASSGGHSAILDSFAKYGILGGIMYVRMIFCVPNDYKEKYHSTKIYRIANASTISIALIAGLNSLPYNIMFMIVMVLPLVVEDIIKWERIDK